uniref:SFRICE_037745 n=1 Tax=Spodoptera frugiperda TaxID=7108 RepID=A0A2H1WYS4_SPOFR
MSDSSGISLYKGHRIASFVASATAEQGVSGSIPGSGKVLLSSFRFFENISVVTRSLELCPFKVIPVFTGCVRLGGKESVRVRNSHQALSYGLSDRLPGPQLEKRKAVK